jgi:hypothetical protein
MSGSTPWFVDELFFMHSVPDSPRLFAPIELNFWMLLGAISRIQYTIEGIVIMAKLRYQWDRLDRLLPPTRTPVNLKTTI